MKSKIRHAFLILVFFLPLLAVNEGFNRILEIITHWNGLEQQAYANRKLGEIASYANFNDHMVIHSKAFSQRLKSLSEKLGKQQLKGYDWQTLSESSFKDPFPIHDLWVFAYDAKSGRSKNLFENASKTVGRRSMEMVFTYLVDLRSDTAIKPFEKRRNEKLLKKIFGNGSDGEIFAKNQAGVATPIIHNNIPSWLIWDFKKGENESALGYFLIVGRNQNLKAAALKLGAQMSGLGTEVAGGFIRLYKTAGADQFFPERLKSFAPFFKWRKSLSLCNENVLDEWHYQGFPWNRTLGDQKLFTRIIPGEKHLLFILLPLAKKPFFVKLLFAFNLFFSALILLLLFRGLILNAWPGKSIRSRFFMVFFLAVTLPLVLYVVSSAAYIFDRLKADEKMLEDKLVSVLKDFDAGKDQIESDYRKAFRECLHDQKLAATLADSGLKEKNKLLQIVDQYFSNNNQQLPLMGIAIYDLSGNKIIGNCTNHSTDEFSTLAGFYGHNIVLNLRRKLTETEPDYPLPKFITDEKNIAAFQAYGRNTTSMERELERFRGRIFRTQYSTGKIVTLHEFIQIEGQTRFAAFISWFDAEVDDKVLQRNAHLLALKNPEVSLAGIKNTPEGKKLVFNLDRSFDQKKISRYRKFAGVAFSSRSEFVKNAVGEESLVAYSSPKFFNTVLVAGMSRDVNRFNHQLRLAAFVLVGSISLLILLVSGAVVFVRIIIPLEEIRNTLDKVKEQKFEFSGDVRRADELGSLNREFKSMIIGLEERQRLASILSDHAIEAISVDNRSLKEQKQNAVVLISDIRDFTTLGERFSAEILTEMLNLHFAEMASCIVANGGRIYKFIGDAIEAVFVESENSESSASVRALKASLLMLEKLENINSKRSRQNKFSYRIGIGLAFGEVISGETGSLDTRLEYAMLGKPFRRAEAYEAFTKEISTLPIVLDSKIANACSEFGIEFDKHKFNGEEVLSVSDYSKTITENVTPFETTEKPIKTEECEENEDLLLKSSNNLPRRPYWRNLVFFVAVISLLFPLFAWNQTVELNYSRATRLRDRTVEESLKQSLMKSEVADLRALLEEFLQQESDAITSRIAWSEVGISSGALLMSSQQMLDNLTGLDLSPTQFAVLHKPGGSSTVEISPDWDLLIFKGRQSNESLCRDLLQRFVKSLISRRLVSVEDIRNRLSALVGLNLEMMYMYNDLHARASVIQREGIEEYLYWQPLLLRNPKFSPDLRQADAAKLLRSRIHDKAVLPVGALLLTLKSSEVGKSFVNILSKVFEFDQVEYAIIDDNGLKAISKNFPLSAESLNMSGNPPELAGWAVDDRQRVFDDKRYRVFVAVEVEKIDRSVFYAFGLPAILFLIGVYFAYLSIYREEAFAKSFSWQLWLGLLSAAVVPLVAVYLVNNWNAVDREKLSLDQERVKLLELFERLERRQFLKEVHTWEKVEKISSDQRLAEQMKKTDRSPASENLDKIEKMILELVGRNFKFNEMIVFSNVGWQKAVYPQKHDRETGEFKRFVQAFISNYFLDLGSAISTADEKMGDAVKSEMTRDAGLEIFRNMFGTDAYFALVHGIGSPVSIFANTGNALINLLPQPSLIKPDKIIFWLLLDDLNSTMRRIFEFAPSPYSIFTESKAMYGALKQPKEGGWVPDLSKFCRWAVATKMPLSIRTQIGNSNFLVEARTGRHNEVMLLVGLIPEDQVLAEVETTRKSFLLLLFAAVATIVIIALILASDIISPVRALTVGAHNVSLQRYDYRIRIDRDDELGKMLQSFNSMAKGLQEKELMGRMVSQTAMMVAADEKSRQAAEKGMKLEVAIMYIAVPGFSTFLETFSTVELIRELKLQVDVVCRTIIANGGDIDKLMGEKILAVFYNKEEKQTSIDSAVRTVACLREAERKGQLNFPITIGIHYGEVIAGLLGVGDHRDFTVIGDSVNTAARICAKASELPRERFLVSSFVADKLNKRQIELRKFGQVSLKGKAEHVELFQLFFNN
jgi:class 3 adenylate cyclase